MKTNEDFFIGDITSGVVQVLTIEQGASADVLVIEDDEVGINTTGPSYNLDVNGDARIVNDLELDEDLIDINGSPGTAGQLLSSLGSGNGVDWIDAPSGGSGHSFGNEDEIPFVNSTTDDMDYTSRFRFIGSDSLWVDSSFVVFNANQLPAIRFNMYNGHVGVNDIAFDVLTIEDEYARFAIGEAASGAQSAQLSVANGIRSKGNMYLDSFVADEDGDFGETGGYVLISTTTGVNWVDTTGIFTGGGGGGSDADWTIGSGVIYNNSDDVGIGTTTPDTEFDVVGDIQVSTSGDSDVAILLRNDDGTANADILFNQAGLIAAEENQYFFIDSDNNQSGSSQFSFRSDAEGTSGGRELLQIGSYSSALHDVEGGYVRFFGGEQNSNVQFENGSSNVTLDASYYAWQYFGSTNITVTLPDHQGVKMILHNDSGSATLTIDPAGSTQINNASSITLGPGESIFVYQIDDNEYITFD